MQSVGYINTMYKAFGQTFIDDDHFLAIVGAARRGDRISTKVLCSDKIPNEVFKKYEETPEDAFSTFFSLRKIF